MKALWNSAPRCKGHALAVAQPPVIRQLVRSACACVLFSLLVTGCVKEEAQAPEPELTDMPGRSAAAQANPVQAYPGLSKQTTWELQQARAATARYKDIRHAIRDGYADINVVAEHMGHHYMKSSLVDGTFDFRSPEILVYNRDEEGNFHLVAVEYAVPLDLPRPEGFTGSHDVWDGESGFPLWLLHAWVWTYNPDGVFHPTNPEVHLH